MSAGAPSIVGMDATADAGKTQEWIVVCIRCLRIKRGGQWTNERAADVCGLSSGFCDACAKLERKAHAAL